MSALRAEPLFERLLKPKQKPVMKNKGFTTSEASCSAEGGT